MYGYIPIASSWGSTANSTKVEAGPQMSPALSNTSAHSANGRVANAASIKSVSSAMASKRALGLTNRSSASHSE